jgi:hypothetical protein
MNFQLLCFHSKNIFHFWQSKQSDANKYFHRLYTRVDIFFWGFNEKRFTEPNWIISRAFCSHLCASKLAGNVSHNYIYISSKEHPPLPIFFKFNYIVDGK